MTRHRVVHDINNANQVFQDEMTGSTFYCQEETEIDTLTGCPKLSSKELNLDAINKDMTVLNGRHDSPETGAIAKELNASGMDGSGTIESKEKDEPKDCESPQNDDARVSKEVRT